MSKHSRHPSSTPPAANVTVPTTPAATTPPVVAPPAPPAPDTATITAPVAVVAPPAPPVAEEDLSGFDPAVQVLLTAMSADARALAVPALRKAFTEDREKKQAEPMRKFNEAINKELPEWLQDKATALGVASLSGKRVVVTFPETGTPEVTVTLPGSKSNGGSGGSGTHRLMPTALLAGGKTAKFLSKEGAVIIEADSPTKLAFLMAEKSHPWTTRKDTYPKGSTQGYPTTVKAFEASGYVVNFVRGERFDVTAK